MYWTICRNRCKWDPDRAREENFNCPILLWDSNSSNKKWSNKDKGIHPKKNKGRARRILPERMENPNQERKVKKRRAKTDRNRNKTTIRGLNPVRPSSRKSMTFIRNNKDYATNWSNN